VSEGQKCECQYGDHRRLETRLIWISTAEPVQRSDFTLNLVLHFPVLLFLLLHFSAPFLFFLLGEHLQIPKASSIQWWNFVRNALHVNMHRLTDFRFDVIMQDGSMTSFHAEIFRRLVNARTTSFQTYTAMPTSSWSIVYTQTVTRKRNPNKATQECCEQWCWQSVKSVHYSVCFLY